MATLVIWLSGVLLLFGSSYMPSVHTILLCSINAIGIQICFYMSLAGFCLRLALPQGIERGSVQRLLLRALAPVGGALHGLHRRYSIRTFDLITNIVGIGGLAIGVVPFLLGYLLRTNRAGT